MEDQEKSYYQKIQEITRKALTKEAVFQRLEQEIFNAIEKSAHRGQDFASIRINSKIEYSMILELLNNFRAQGFGTNYSKWNGNEKFIFIFWRRDIVSNEV